MESNSLKRWLIDCVKSRGGNDLTVTVGDMTSVSMGCTYPLVDLVFNAIFNIQTQEGQIEWFRNAEKHLTDDGVFAIEAAVPDA